MHRYLLSVTAAIAFILGAASDAKAQAAVFGFDDHNGSPSSGTYSPGDSFTFSINLHFIPGGTVTNVDGLSYWFEQMEAAPFYFSITNRDLTGSQFTFPQTGNLVYPQSLSPSNASDLGAITQDGAGRPGGDYLIANLTIKIDPSAAPGVYHIENTTTGGKTSVVFDNTGTHSVAIPQSVYTITIVPEPSSLALCATGLPFALGFLRRFRAGRNR